jgi:diguanylate cyclase (GGDEF)-like protein/PAS domain S-box-containing protein/putative nucleotidyltransferase with HDIG domain
MSDDQQHRSGGGGPRVERPASVAVDADQRLLRVDEVAAALLGATAEELLASGATIGLRMPDGTPVSAEAHPAVIAIRTGAAVEESVFALERTYDAWAWVRLSAIPVADGAELRIVDLSSDRALVAALERARRLESVLHQIDDYVYVWEYHPDGTSWPIAESIPSRRFFRLDPHDGVSDEDLWRRRVHPDDRHLYDIVTTAQSEGRGGTGEYRLAHEDGSVVHVFDRWHGVVRRDGVAVVEGVISDVTAMRAAEAAGRASEERFRVLAAAAPVGIYIADADGRIVYANDRWQQIYGLTGGDELDDRWADAVHPDAREEALEIWHAAVRSGQAYEATLRLQKADGREAWIASRGAPMHDEHGGVMGYVGTDDDVTDRVIATRELERLSQTDPLTGLANRRRINERITAAVEVAHLDPTTTPGVILFDVDHFKEVNDVYGHYAGDAVLADTAQRITAALAPGEEAGRWGGEEFIVLVQTARDVETLSRTADRIRRSISATPISAAGAPLTIHASAGAAIRTPSVESGSMLVDRADRALYAAKRRGRNRTVRFDEVNPGDSANDEAPVLRIARGLALAATVREGMPELHFQQVADLAVQIAEIVGLAEGFVMRCRLGGLLHDVGKLAIPDRILAKRGPLDEEEWAVMRGHAEIGAQIIARVGGLDAAVDAVRHHHERYDGTGYPDGIAGDFIPIEARIVAAADAFSAITSDRTYARGRDQNLALDEIERSAGTHLDPVVAYAVRHAIDLRRASDSARLARYDAA